MMRPTALAVVAAALLTACGGNGGDSAKSWQEQLGCTQVTQVHKELTAMSVFTCTTADGTVTRVVTFSDTQARDKWIDAAEKLIGFEVIKKGDTWVQTKAPNEGR